VPWDEVPEANRALMIATVGGMRDGMVAAGRAREGKSSG